jgi:type IV secretion system protein VirB3
MKPGARQLTLDPLYVAATRPPMRWGVTYAALLVNLVVTLELFLVSRNLLMLLLAVPIHAACVGLCHKDARIFDLLLLWFRVHLTTRVACGAGWGAATYSPLPLSRPDVKGRRAVPLPTAILPFVLPTVWPSVLSTATPT